jgi:hypothetical protein
MSGVATNPGITMAAGSVCKNISLDCNNVANHRLSGTVLQTMCVNCEAFGMATTKSGFNGAKGKRCIARTSTANTVNGFLGPAEDSYAYALTGTTSRGFSLGTVVTHKNCVAWNCTQGFNSVQANGCVAYACGNGFYLNNYEAFGETDHERNVAYGCTGYGFLSANAAGQCDGIFDSCAGGSNSSGNVSAEILPYATNFKTLTGDPFVSGGAGGDYRLNTGAGSLLKGSGNFSIGGLTLTTGSPSIGVTESSAGSAGLVKGPFSAMR